MNRYNFGLGSADYTHASTGPGAETTTRSTPSRPGDDLTIMKPPAPTINATTGINHQSKSPLEKWFNENRVI